MRQIFFLGAAILGTMLTGCQQAVVNAPIIPVEENVVLRSESFRPEVMLSGTIEADQSVWLSSRVSGRVKSLKVDVGDVVRAGQLVAQFDAVDDQSHVAYENAVHQLAATKISTESTVQNAMIELDNARQQHFQTQQQERAARQQLADTLRAKTASSQVVAERVVYFLDMTLGASPRFEYGSNENRILAIGNNNQVGRQEVKNQTLQLVAEQKKLENDRRTDPVEQATELLDFLEQVYDTTDEFYTLVRQTPATSRFPLSQKNQVQRVVEQQLAEVSRERLTLELQRRSTQTEWERLGLGLVQTQSAVDAAVSRLRSTRAMSQQQVQVAENQLSSTSTMQNELEIRAPFSGVIVERLVDAGALVAPGQPMFRLADRSTLKILTDIPDTQVSSVARGMPVKIRIDGLVDIFSGKITRIDPAVNPQTRTLGIEIEFDVVPEVVRLGMFARITIELPEVQTFFVPKRFLEVRFLESVVRLADGKIVAVQRGAERTGEVQIVAPELKNGDVLIMPR